MAMQHPVPAPFLEQIGDVTVSFALLENVLQSLGSAFMHSSEAQIVLVELPFRALRGVLFSLAKERLGDSPKLKTLASLLHRAGEVEEKRNQVTHSVWAAGDKTPPTITRVKQTAKQKAGFKVLFEAWGIDRFQNLTSELLELANDVQRFHLECVGASAPTQPAISGAASHAPPPSA